ncbi:flagellar biosynthetic protein FliP [Roseibium aquae]|uniref:Flagellar biosynthetic protein FliP n=1 Tax=Roseibium aquae TaxID=1323746 RepID=A0A916WXE7_9HYPH|nr:flagellar type III secretion system pore protein FliP [Roseibium aquae]GGB37438.1 flagellar biosynthetic protein FliP [Roseibium aquae]
MIKHVSRKPARLLLLAGLTAGLSLLFSGAGWAQEITLGFADDATLTERAVQLVALITVLSLAPSILIMVTSFTRIVVVLSLLRSAIGLQTAPPNMVMISLALFLTAFIMAPTFQIAYDEGVQPLMEGTIEFDQAFERAVDPFRDFMLSQVREKDLMLFQELSGQEAPQTPEDLALSTLVPAFMISELRRAFEIGFLLYLPFLIIDLVIASVLMSMGMMMLPPVVISLPFKLIFFVLVDGWNLVAGSLVQSFGGG